MAATQIYDSSNLPVSNADFESIKQDLINFYKTTEEFKDYDFESSRMSQQMNLLAYTTLYNQQYSNVALYESFLRTAQTRQAVVQNAQDKGYVPASESTSKDIIGVYATTLGDDTPTSIDIPANTPFIGVVNGIFNYNFITWEKISIPYDNTLDQYHDEIKIVQGYRASQFFTFDSSSEIVLFDDDIDRNYINVYITDNTGGTSGQYTNWTNRSIIGVEPSAKAFYVNETSDGYTRIYFGTSVQDDTDPTQFNFIGGLKPAEGSTVKVEYLKTDGKIANGSINYTFVGTLDNAVISSIVQNPNNDPLYNGSYGASDKETIERIRINASLFQETQQRIVTEYDYESFVRSNFGSYVQAVKAYGNSDNPGYVFLSIKPIDALELTELQSSDITSFLKQYNILTITPVITTPDYLYINHYINVNYKPSAVPEGTAFLKNEITESLDTYYNDQVELFGGAYHTSRALKYIDDSNASILGSYITITAIIEVDDSFIVASPANGISFMNPLYDVWTRNPLTFTDDSGVTSEINLFSIGSDMITGPFKEGDIDSTIEQYPPGTYNRIITAENDTLVVDDDIVTPINDNNIIVDDNNLVPPFTGDNIPPIVDQDAPIIDDIDVNDTTDDTTTGVTSSIAANDPGMYIDQSIPINLNNDYYYKVGSINKDSGILKYDFNNIGIASKIYTNQLIFEATTTRNDIYSKDGGIIVFEPALRPEYLSIQTEQIENVQ